MPHRYPPEMRRQAVELALSGTRAKRFAATLAVSEATIYNWIKQEKIACGEIVGLNTEEALELATAKRRIRQLETELAVARQAHEVFLSQDLAPKALTR